MRVAVDGLYITLVLCITIFLLTQENLSDGGIG